MNADERRFGLSDPRLSAFISAFEPGRWIHGTPVDRLTPGNIYVIDFFCTASGPCKVTIPRVNQAARKFKGSGVEVIGIAVMERDYSLVEPYVSKMGEKMTYPVAIDDITTGAEGKFVSGWLAAAGKLSLPMTFVIDKDGKIAWIGNPANGLDRIISQLIEGKFNPSHEAELSQSRESYQQYVLSAVRQKDYPKLIGIIDDISEKDPEFGRGLQIMKFQAQVAEREFKDAYATASALADSKDADPDVLNVIAWTIVDSADMPDRNLDVAFKAANAANELTEHNRADILDTLARVEFDRGNFAKAVEIQTRAVAKSDADLRGELVDRLNKYEAKQNQGGK